MKNLSATFAKITAVVACALTLGSCSRAEYAMLPKSSSYHGVTRVSTPVPASEPTAVASAPATPAAASELMAPAKTAVPAIKPVATTAAPATRSAPTAPAASSASAAGTAALASAPAAPKMTRVQRFAASQLVKKLNKAVVGTRFEKQLNTASTQKLSGNIRLGIILMVIGAVVALLPGLFRLLGLIIFIVGLLFLLLALLDMV